MADKIHEQAKSRASTNRPLIVALLFLISMAFPITAFVGIVLAYVFRNGEHEDWESSHLTYLINTFWLFFIPTLIIMIGCFAAIMQRNFSDWLFAPLILVAILGVHALVRSVLSLVSALSSVPMAKPNSWLF